jgi:hypothetical protein
MNKGIEQIKLLLSMALLAVKALKGKQVFEVIAEVSKIFKVNFKELALEIKDLKGDEVVELIAFLIENGIKEAVANKAINYFSKAERPSFSGVVRELAKTK